ncbi:MAG: N-acetylated-alpha-linked acidic dipeptidase [Blastocatellia bacterium]|nr:N-acetylated-alpha-linked acidic dipeptidase [Blastocatellia bacterium]
MKNIGRLVSAVLVLALLGLPLTIRSVFAQGQAETVALDGFTPTDSLAERRWEIQFSGVPAAASAREHLRRLTAEPHVAGTPEDYATAVYVRDQMRGFGLTSDLKEYQVLLPYPRRPAIVEMVTPRRERLRTTEPIIPEDPSTSNPKIISLFNGYGASGDVTAPVVYVNYGLPGDYEALKKIGVDVKGKIAIARYGNSFRGVKAKLAQDNGAVALIIYSDPADDGYVQGDVYPKGPMRPEGSAQRGSVQFLFVYPGDPLTPGAPAIPGTPRLSMAEVTNMPRIPVQPMSYGDARRLLQPMRGPLRPKGFQGGLPFSYHVGGTNDVRVHLKTDIEFVTRTIWNVITRIDGDEEKDRWVVLGNHRDAWTFGAVDPNSGTTAMLEVGKGLGQLGKSGWKPRRTMFLCSWDAEEQGLIGSTEWAEENAGELREKAVAYLNIDSAVSGPNFGASSVPSLWKFIRAATRDVRDPKTRKTVYQVWKERARANLPSAELTDSVTGADTPIAEARIGALGSGSDFTPFLQHLGVPAMDMGFGGDYGVYHSAYDTFYWMSHFGDPTFEYHVTAARVLGILAMRLADSGGLPLDYTDYATELGDFLSETRKLAGRAKLSSSFDARAIQEAINDLAQEASRIEKRRDETVLEIERTRVEASNAHPRAVARLRRINDALMGAERALTDDRGLRGRIWYKHQVYAPGFYTGYAALPLPDLRQAIEERNSANAGEAAQRLVESIKRATEVLRRGRE